MKKVLSILLFLVIIAGGIGFGVNAANGLKGDTPKKEVLPAQESSANEETTEEVVQEKAPGIPKKIRIPSINVDAAIEPVGVKGSNRQMETPENADNGGWYSLGVKPGQKGSAVIAGHLDKVDSSPAVFWKVSELQPGDQIISVDENGEEFTFEVTQVTQYPYDDFPIAKVFATSGPAMLNLISCKGEWDNVKKNYSHRTVVYSKLVE